MEWIDLMTKWWFADKADKWLYGELQKRFDYYKGLIAEDLKDAVEFRKVNLDHLLSLRPIF